MVKNFEIQILNLVSVNLLEIENSHMMLRKMLFTAITNRNSDLNLTFYL